MPDAQSYSNQDLLQIAAVIAKKYVESGGKVSPTDTVTAVLKPYRDSMTDQHVRRVCEYSYHSIYKKMHEGGTTRGSAQKVVEFDPPDAERVTRALGVPVVPSISPNLTPTTTGAAMPASNKSASAPSSGQWSFASGAAPPMQRAPTWSPEAADAQKRASEEEALLDKRRADLAARSLAEKRANLPTHGDVVEAAQSACRLLEKESSRASFRAKCALQDLMKAASDLCASGVPSIDVIRLLAAGVRDDQATHPMADALASTFGEAIERDYPVNKQASSPRAINPAHPFVALAGRTLDALIEHQTKQAALEIAEQHLVAARRSLVVDEALRLHDVKRASDGTTRTGPLHPSGLSPDAVKAADAMSRGIYAAAHGIAGMGGGLASKDPHAHQRTAEDAGRAKFRAGVLGGAAGAAIGALAPEAHNLLTSVGNRLGVPGALSKALMGTVTVGAAAVAGSQMAGLARKTLGPPKPPVDTPSADPMTPKAAAEPATLPGVYRVPEVLRATFEIPEDQDGWRVFGSEELAHMKAAGIEVERAPEDVSAAYWRGVFGAGSDTSGAKSANELWNGYAKAIDWIADKPAAFVRGGWRGGLHGGLAGAASGGLAGGVSGGMAHLMGHGDPQDTSLFQAGTRGAVRGGIAGGTVGGALGAWAGRAGEMFAPKDMPTFLPNIAAGGLALGAPSGFIGGLPNWMTDRVRDRMSGGSARDPATPAGSPSSGGLPGAGTAPPPVGGEPPHNEVAKVAGTINSGLNALGKVQSAIPSNIRHAAPLAVAGYTGVKQVGAAFRDPNTGFRAMRDGVLHPPAYPGYTPPG